MIFEGEMGFLHGDTGFMLHLFCILKAAGRFYPQTLGQRRR